MLEIVPSIKLRVISQSRIKGMSCLRQYFWHWIMNLEPRSINMNFWYGGCLHAGFEDYLLTRSCSSSHLSMLAESKKRLSKYSLTAEQKEEVSFQKKLLEIILDGAIQSKIFKDIRLTEKEKKIVLPIVPNITFLGIIDGLGAYKKEDCMLEIKTASSVSDSYFASLGFDIQIHSYYSALKKLTGRAPPVCCFCIFRKVQKQIKKGQSRSAFLDEIRQDVKDRPEFYYILYEHRFGKRLAEEAFINITNTSLLLRDIYHRNKKIKELLNPLNWPCNDSQCSSYGQCAYLILCRNLSKWQVYAKMFRQKSIMFDEEKAELMTERK